MRPTHILWRQNIGWHFAKHWKVQGKRKPIDTLVEKTLTQKGIRIYKPEDLFKEARTFTKVDVVGFREKPLVLDASHPDWHSRTLLTYKDDNVLLEGLLQAKIITKTVELKQGLPENILSKQVSKEINKHVKRIILSSHIFDAEQKKLPKLKDPQRPAWNFPRIYGVTQERVSKLMITKLLQLIEMTSEDDITKQRYISNDLHFSFPFEKNGDLIQFQVKGETLITSLKPLSRVTTDLTDNLNLPDIFPIKATITLNEENIYRLENIYPIQQSILKSHPHTLFIHYNKEEVKNLFEEEVTESQIYGRSLLKTFTIAAAYARQKYGETIKQLPEPVVLQCVQTDGRLFHFGLLQLNTLDFDGDGEKNIWYQTSRLPLFETCRYESGQPILKGYDDGEVIKHLYSFYNNV